MCCWRSYIYLFGDLKTKRLTRRNQFEKGLIKPNDSEATIMAMRLMVDELTAGKSEAIDVWFGIRVNFANGGGGIRCLRLNITLEPIEVSPAIVLQVSKICESAFKGEVEVVFHIHYCSRSIPEEEPVKFPAAQNNTRIGYARLE